MSLKLRECTFVVHETIQDKSLVDVQEISDLAYSTSSQFGELPIHVKEEEPVLGNPAFPFKIRKDEELLLKDEFIVKEESQERLCDFIPLPTEEIYVKDEFTLQPSASVGLKGISKINNYYVCDVCQYQSMDIMKLKTHIIVHIKEKPFKCFECDYAFSSKFEITLHILNRHSAIFRCKQCKYTTIATHEMDQHIMIHNVEEEEHMKILAAEKPFKCRHCEYRAAKKYFLEKHNMLKHSPENDFKCKECSFSSLLKSKLHEHMKVHKKRKRVD